MVSFSRPFATTGVQILLRKPDNSARGLGVVFIPFSVPLWICIIAALLITTSVIFFLERFRMPTQETERGTNSKRLNLVGSFQFIMSSTLCRGLYVSPLCKKLYIHFMNRIPQVLREKRVCHKFQTFYSKILESRILKYNLLYLTVVLQDCVFLLSFLLACLLFLVTYM